MAFMTVLQDSGILPALVIYSVSPFIAKKYNIELPDFYSKTPGSILIRWSNYLFYVVDSGNALRYCAIGAARFRMKLVIKSASGFSVLFKIRDEVGHEK